MSFTWSTTLTVGPATTHSKGDKIILPPSALESIDKAHSLAPPPPPPAPDLNYDPTSWANPSPPSPPRNGHHARTPQDLPSPLTFQVRNPANRLLTHGGVKEFSAEEGKIQLPTWMMETLSLSEGDQVMVKYAPLQKGTWAKIRPLSADFLQVTDIRALLEAVLRSHYTTLTRGEMLKVHHGRQEFAFVVEDLLPAPGEAVCITDTDLEVEFAPLEDSMTMTSGGSHGSKTQSTVLRIGSDVVGQVAIDQYQRWTIDIPDRTSGITVHVDVEEAGDLDVLVSIKEPVTLQDHVWANFESLGPRTIVIPASDKDYSSQQDSKTIHIGVYGREPLAEASGSLTAGDEITYRIRVEHNDDASGSQSTATSSETDSMEGVEASVPNKGADGYQECTNCGSWIPERTMILHSNFCHRNNAKCDKCGLIMKKEDLPEHYHCDHCDKHGHISEKKKHMEIYHGWYQCTCESFESPSLPELALHRRTTCPDRFIICRYCHILVQQGAPASDARDRIRGLASHESYCGNRTIECQKCTQLVSLKNVQVHAQHHEHQRQNQPTPLLCANQNCFRGKATPSNVLGTCALCFGPFWVSTEDPRHQKMLQRLAKKYHAQLTEGCKNSWCRNAYCATARKQTMEANAAAAEMMTILKEAKIASQKGDQQLWLCVDEGTNDRRMAAELLETDLKGRFRLEWCIKAMEAVKTGDMEEAAQWLSSHAPRKLR